MNQIEQIKNSFGLIKMPFTNLVPVKELYMSSSFQEAHARISLALETENIAVLTGETGTGKSSILRYFTYSLDPNSYKPIYIPADPNIKIAEIARQALLELQLEVPYNSASALRKFKKTIVQLNKDKRIKPVLIIDESQELSPKTFLSLKPLLNYHMDSKNYLFILLCGQNPLNDIINLYPLESLNRRIRIHYSMQSFSLKETAEYITHQMKNCGLDRNIFPDEVKAKIFNTSKGIISEINDICFNLIIQAASQSKDLIELSMLDVVLKTRKKGDTGK